MISLTELQNSPLKALSWKEPYGTLMLPPHNKIETRTWNTKYRGLVLLCASKKEYPWNVVRSISGQQQFDRILKSFEQKRSGYFSSDINGMAFAIGHLVDCRPMTSADENFAFVEYKHPWQEARYTKTGKKMKTYQLFAHIYKDVTPIEPFAWKGSQGFRPVPQDIISQIKFCQTLETV